ncbi:hypothetical protein PHYPO_G00219830 [Pangasianodon hypophthalmus]|uniref:Uncharacterized protein n=1 Tax=Pangasianodon hypophthalmus TaxID=310915 RepID=A0A5N5NW25_PANHP|nr:hypothetical protein PHYPO_G00219830 [Pangasianodon hypophthalmus]
MADTNSASDTQVLLQSMLQRLRLQPRPASNSAHTQDEVQYNATLIEQTGSAGESPPQTPPMYNFDFSMDSNFNVTNLARPLSPGSTGVTTSLSQEFAKGIDVHTPGMSSTPKRRTLSWGFMSNHTVSGGNSDVRTSADDGVMPKQVRKQKFSLTKMSDGSVQTESNIQGQGVGQKGWTQKMKEKWKERHKSIPRREQDDSERQEQSKVANRIRSPIPIQTGPNETNTTTAFNEEVSVQSQPINNGPVESISSPLDHMSETLFSPGSFNLMEEIFTGQEWAKFLPYSTSSQLASSSIPQDQRIGLTSSISQSSQNEQTLLSQWNYREATGLDLGMTQSKMNSGSFHNMDTTEYMFNQRKTSDFGMHPMSELHNGQYGLSDSGSNHVESMDLHVSPLGNNYTIKEQAHIYPYKQSNSIQLNINQTLPSEQSANQSQATEITHKQPGSVHEVLPQLDLSYLQSKDNSSLKKQVSLSRKRGHSTERRGSNEWRSETAEIHEWRHNSSPSDPAPSLSPASSISSLQHSISQDSESSVSTETVIKKRKVENKRHVRFADEVTIVPPLVLSDDDSDADDEDYCHNGNEGNDDSGEESLSRPYVPRWIEALRSKANRKPKLKLPRRTKKYRFV